jgi:hypothetical protein
MGFPNRTPHRGTYNYSILITTETHYVLGKILVMQLNFSHSKNITEITD